MSTRRASSRRGPPSWRRRSPRMARSPCRRPSSPSTEPSGAGAMPGLPGKPTRRQARCCPRTARRGCGPPRSASAPTFKARRLEPEETMADLYDIGEKPPLGEVPARMQAHQCVPKPKRLTWEAAGCFLLCASTAYRMLMGWAPHTVERGDVVLVWGATGGLGSMALEIIRAQGGRSVAVVSDEAKRKFCVEHGAAGVINRTQFDHWGPMPDTKDGKAYGNWAKGARAFGKATWDPLGEKPNPPFFSGHPAKSRSPPRNSCA